MTDRVLIVQMTTSEATDWMLENPNRVMTIQATESVAMELPDAPDGVWVRNGVMSSPGLFDVRGDEVWYYTGGHVEYGAIVVQVS